MSSAEQDSHCSYCGAAFPHTSGWPRRCSACARTSYRSPLPVAVVLLPVADGDDTCLTVIRRTIEPRSGLLALPGGFIDHGEDWRQAVVRELYEETGITADAGEVRLADVLSAPAGRLLVFGLLRRRSIEDLPPSAPTNETEGWELLRTSAEMAFPLHTRAVRAWFAGQYAHGPAPHPTD